MKESLISIWGKRNPEYEIQYEDSIVKLFTEYGKGTNQYSASHAKILGAGYEAYIMAFFIGLYRNERIPLTTDSSKKTRFGHPIMYWGNQETRKERKSYNGLINYIFAALVAKTDIDIIAVDKGDITSRSAVDALICTMEEYTNAGFNFMMDKIDDNPGYFYRNEAFLDIFTSFLQNSTSNDTSHAWHSDDEPEDLSDEKSSNISVNKVDEEADSLD